MICPACKAGPVRVLDSRPYAEYVRRRRECEACSYRYRTYEMRIPLDGRARMVTIRGGRVELVDLEKVWAPTEGAIT